MCEFTLGSHLVRLEQQQRGLIAISADLDGRIQRALDAHARGCGEDELELGDHLMMEAIRCAISMHLDGSAARAR
jgi:hypothetical protein